MSEFLYNLEMGKPFLAETQNTEPIKRKEKSNYKELLNGKKAKQNKI